MERDRRVQRIGVVHRGKRPPPVKFRCTNGIISNIAWAKMYISKIGW